MKTKDIIKVILGVFLILFLFNMFCIMDSNSRKIAKLQSDVNFYKNKFQHMLIEQNVNLYEFYNNSLNRFTSLEEYLGIEFHKQEYEIKYFHNKKTKI